MAENSPIEWTDHTWSPWEGCQKVGPGCDHCYAEGMNRWLRKGENWGPGAPRREYSDAHWQKPLRWNAAAAKAGTRVRVFPSVCDPFDNAVSNTLRAKFLALIYRTPHIDWLLLTKRIGNVPALMEECTEPGKQWVLPPNVWLGATVVSQEEADRDIPKLMRVPARVRFLSMEPLLGPVDLQYPEGVYGTGPRMCCSGFECGCMGKPIDPPLIWGINWVIVGGESGHGARPLQLQWAWDVVRQCQAARVPVMVKQLGQHVLDHGMAGPGEHWPAGIVRQHHPRRDELDPGFIVHLKNRKGGDWSEWPEDLRVRQFPEAR